MKQAPFSTIILFALLAVATSADDVARKSRRLQQLCHPERGGGISTPGIGGFYTHPEIDGVKVDFCLKPGSGCGKQVADVYCQRKGLAFSDSYVAWTFAGSACGKTIHIGNKKACTGPDCTGFRVISCAGTLVPDILDTILGTPQAPPKAVPVAQEVIPDNPPAPVSPPEDLTKDTPALSDNPPKEPISQTLDLEGSQAPGQTTNSGQSPNSSVEADSQASKSGAQKENDSTLTSPVSADGSGEGSEQDTIPKKVEGASTTQSPVKDDTSTDASEDKADTSAPSKTPDAGKKETNTENTQQSSANEQRTGSNKPPVDSSKEESDDGVVIDHPDLGNVVLPGQENTGNKEAPAAPSATGGSTDQKKAPNSAHDQDALFCQERGSQSASAAARSGCGSVISQCGSDASIAKSQENLGGVAGRRLSQSLVNSSACKTLFADECQAAAFDNATGLCATLMGSGPNPGEERAGCKTAEEAREIFKSIVKDSCAIFMAGAFP